jgi:BirA family biotin operon repressor/biotin-[acetyl-CoA-carboxylase] ligase
VDEDFSSIGAGLPDPFRLLVKESVGSTNDEIRTRAEAGAPEGLIILAHRQTEGRGRRGAAWFSPPGESLAFSVLIKPTEPKALWPRLALATGLAVAEALEQFIPLVGIKWPNDIWIGRRKIAGILVEAGKDFAIVGIGLNVNTTDFPPEVSETATSLALETGNPISRPEVLAAIIRNLNNRRHQIGTDFHQVIDAIRLRCVLTGNAVSLLTPNGPRTGVVEKISSKGELILRTHGGLETFLQADEVRLI